MLNIKHWHNICSITNYLSQLFTGFVNYWLNTLLNTVYSPMRNVDKNLHDYKFSHHTNLEIFDVFLKRKKIFKFNDLVESTREVLHSLEIREFLPVKFAWLGVTLIFFVTGCTLLVRLLSDRGRQSSSCREAVWQRLVGFSYITSEYFQVIKVNCLECNNQLSSSKENRN